MSLQSTLMGAGLVGVLLLASEVWEVGLGLGVESARGAEIKGKKHAYR